MALILHGTNGITDVNGTAAAPAITGTDTDTGVFFGTNTVSLSTNGTERLQIDSSGNLGLGVTPSAWASPFKAIQGGGSGYSSYFAFQSNTYACKTGVNHYYNGSNYVYAANAAAARFDINENNFNWNIAASGTAGATISFTQAMTLDASGNLGVGVTSVSSDISGSAKVIGICDSTTTNLASLRLGSGSTFASGTKMEVFAAGGSCGLYGQSNVPMVFSTNATERARIDSSGNFYVGGSTLSSSFSTYSGARQYIYGSAAIQLRDPANTSGRTWQVGPEAASGGTFIVYNAASTGVYVAYGGTSWSANSDERVKDIIEPITDAANKVSTLRTVIGKYKKDADGVRRSFLIAQDVQAVLPEAVNVQEDEIGTLGVSYTDVIPLLVAAIKEQQAIITQLQADVAALKGQA